MKEMNRRQFLNYSLRSKTGVILGSAALGLSSERAFVVNNKGVFDLIGSEPRANGEI